MHVYAPALHMQGTHWTTAPLSTLGSPREAGGPPTQWFPTSGMLTIFNSNIVIYFLHELWTFWLTARKLLKFASADFSWRFNSPFKVHRIPYKNCSAGQGGHTQLSTAFWCPRSTASDTLGTYTRYMFLPSFVAFWNVIHLPSPFLPGL